MYLIVVVVVL